MKPTRAEMASNAALMVIWVAPELDPELDPVLVSGRGAPVAVASTPPPETNPEAVLSAWNEEPNAMAALWNELKLPLPEAGALMVPTIPKPPQWVSCLQWK